LQQIDLLLVKNLVVGYMCAPNDKKPDVVPLLAAVLEFNKDDMQRVQQGGNSGWLAYIRGHQAPNYSITAQFIKFLEAEAAESTTSATVQAKAVGRTTTGPMLNVDTSGMGVSLERRWIN
jgi:hypothetical protein